ncbi:MAG: acyl-CoA dehydrogenase C-terminal domain-containing protein, partial [Sedimenticola sp.]|nr:acyl-CoA dehydrogenase C-terminal domain-containing protein [Sedimenticola sp.]
RKLFIHEGRLPQRFFNLLNSFIAEQNGNESMTQYIAPLADAIKLLQELTGWLVEQGTRNPDELGAAATDYLRIFALTTLAWLWADMARVAREKESSDNTGFYTTKLRTARFFMGRLLPQIHGLALGIRSGADLMMEFSDEEF